MLSELFRGAFVQPEPLYNQGPPPVDSIPELAELHQPLVVGRGKKRDTDEGAHHSPAAHTYQEKTEAEMMQMVMEVPLEGEDGGWDRAMDI